MPRTASSLLTTKVTERHKGSCSTSPRGTRGCADAAMAVDNVIVQLPVPHSAKQQLLGEVRQERRAVSIGTR
jgi:hypothetical protein